jgi:type II secretory pathway component PulC
MIHFEVVEDDGDRTLYLEGVTVDGQRVLVGWIERGRVVQTGSGRKVEWGFTPADNDYPRGKVSLKGISPAYEDARSFAANKWGPGLELLHEHRAE